MSRIVVLFQIVEYQITNFSEGWTSRGYAPRGKWRRCHPQAAKSLRHVRQGELQDR